MFCPACGVENPDGARFCRGCGRPLTGDVGGSVDVSATGGRRGWWWGFGVLVVVVGVAAWWFVAGPGGPAGGVSGVVGVDGGVVSLDGVVVSVPAGVVSGPVSVSLRVEDHPVGGSGGSVSAVPGPVSIGIDGEWSGVVTLSIPVDGAALGGGVPVLGYFDEGLGRWVPVASTYEGGMVVAQVDHVSLWDVFTPSWWNYQIQDVLGNRADPPVCVGGVPDWVDDLNVVDERNAPLLACGESTVDGRLRLRVVANRGYSMTLDANVPMGAVEGGTVDIGHVFAEVLYHQYGSRVYLPAGDESVLVFDKPDGLMEGSIEVRGSTDVFSVAGDLVVEALGAANVDGTHLESYLSCFVADIDTADAGGDTADMVREATGALLSCVDDYTELLGGAVSTGLRRFLIAVDVWDLTGTVAETIADSTNDLAYIGVLLNPTAIQDGATTTTTGGEPLAWDDIADAVGCHGDCVVTGTVSFTHPSWGPSTLATYLTPPPGGTTGIVVFDGANEERWRWEMAEGEMQYEWQPASDATSGGVFGNLGKYAVGDSKDALGHLFVAYNPGRYEGIIVLVPTPDGFDSLGGLRPDGTWAGFYYAELGDVDRDDQFEILQYDNNCRPGCAGGRVTGQVLRWDGSDYTPDWDWHYTYPIGDPDGHPLGDFTSAKYRYLFGEAVEGEPHWSGCTPVTSDTLPDGVWYGYITAWTEEGVEFDLACDLGEGMDRNTNPTTRFLRWANDAQVYAWAAEDPYAYIVGFWSPKNLIGGDVKLLYPVGDPSWPDAPPPPVLLYINDGVVTELEALFRS